MLTELMDRLIELGTTWISLLLLATWRVLPIFVLVTGLGLAFRRRLSPAIHALLWTIVVARFLLPVSFGSQLSLHGPIDSASSAVFGVPANRVERNPSAEHASRLPNFASTGSLEFYPQKSQSKPAATQTLVEVTGTAVLLTVMLVTIGFLFRSIFSHVRFAIGLRSCRVLADQKLIDLLLRECDSLGVGRRPMVREVPSLAAPAVFGLLRHSICLPSNFVNTLTAQELRWVLRHELAHIRRRDVAVMVMATVAGACHWFNPLVWITVSRLRAAMEAAADRLAIADLSQSEAASYGHLLLRLAESNGASLRSPTLGLLPFASGKHLKQRVELLMLATKQHGTMSRSFAVVLVMAVALMGLTDASEIVQQKKPEVHLLKNDSTENLVANTELDAWSARENEGPTITKEYDIDSILKTMRLPKAIAESGKDLKSQLMIWLPFLPSADSQFRVEGRKLIADLNSRQHSELAQSLEIWKKGEPRQICIETRFIQTNVKLASSIDWARRRIVGMDVKGFGPAIAARITDQELGFIVRAVETDRDGNIMFAPKVTCFDGQTATIADQVQRPFVTGVEPREDGSIQPVVSVLDEGLKFVLTPRTNGDDGVTLAFEVRASNIGKVSYANIPIRQPNQLEPHVTVQVPATEIKTVNSTVKLDVGESVVVAIPRVFSLEPASNSDKMTLVTLTPRILSLQEVTAPAVVR